MKAERERDRKKIVEEITSKTFPNLFSTKTKHQPVEPKAQLSPHRINAKKISPRHITVKLFQVQEKILKVAREKQLITYGETAGLLLEAMKTEDKRMAMLKETVNQKIYTQRNYPPKAKVNVIKMSIILKLIYSAIKIPT